MLLLKYINEIDLIFNGLIMWSIMVPESISIRIFCEGSGSMEWIKSIMLHYKMLLLQK